MTLALFARSGHLALSRGHCLASEIRNQDYERLQELGQGSGSSLSVGVYKGARMASAVSERSFESPHHRAIELRGIPVRFLGQLSVHNPESSPVLSEYFIS